MEKNNSHPPKFHIEKFRIRNYEVDMHDQVPVQALCAYMEESAGMHADLLGVSVEELHSRGLAWVLVRLRVEVDALPGTGDEVLVKTWPVCVERMQFRRDFIITDGKGKRLARAVSEWVVINLETRKIERIPAFIAAIQHENPEQALPTEKMRLDGQEDAPELAQFKVRKADMDRNRHVNNVRFVDWILESVPDETSQNKRLSSLQLMFRAEAVYGDTVLARGREGEDGAFAHGLFRLSDGQELVRARTVWQAGGQ